MIESFFFTRRANESAGIATFMIVDCFTHTWESRNQLGRGVSNGTSRGLFPTLQEGTNAGMSRHLAATQPVTTTFVLGFKSLYLEAEIPNDRVADYVRTHPGRLVGFAGIDPSNPKEAVVEVRRAREQLGMRGVAVAPAAQDFHPSNSQAMRVYAEIGEMGLPILFHTGVHLSAATKLQYAQPMLLEEIARELPALRIVVAHLGFPWVAETLVLLAKHENVFAEMSWLVHQPWQAYQALIGAYQFGVMDKLLFGSGFPYSAASHCIEALYSLNHLCHGTNLPTIPRDHLRGIVERDALSLLGIAQPAPAARKAPPPEEE